MTEPPQPVEIVIPDSVMDQIREAPPEVVDQFAETIARIKANGGIPDTADARALVPHPVDHSAGQPRVYVPATRSVSYLRNAVADISPPTVATFDQELTEDTSGPTSADRIRGLRGFVLRWVEYIAMTGDHDLSNWLNDARTAEDFADRYADATRRVHAEHFPDAGRGPSPLAIVVTRNGDYWQAVCPVTLLRVTRDTEDEARAGLHAALLGLLTGM